jgi:hypothetical protein
MIYRFLIATLVFMFWSSPLIAASFETSLDVNGDGNADILWRNKTTGQNWLWTMNGVVVDESKSLNTIPLNWEIVGRGDFDGDGKSDILWRNNDSGRNYIYLMDGFTIRTSQELNYLPNFDWKVKGVTDLNGDGKDDIVWHHQQTGKTWIYLIDGISITSSKAANTVSDLDWEIVATGDINGDSKGDVIWRHKTSGKNFVWLMNGTAISDSYVLNTAPTSWDIAGSGDLDGDGTDDIIWRNSEGVNWAYLMKGGQIATSKQINKIANTDWQIRTIGDLNGDGKADIFWRNQETGKTYAYLMDGTNILSAGYSSVISLKWQVITDSTIALSTDEVVSDAELLLPGTWKVTESYSICSSPLTIHYSTATFEYNEGVYAYQKAFINDIFFEGTSCNSTVNNAADETAVFSASDLVSATELEAIFDDSEIQNITINSADKFTVSLVFGSGNGDVTVTQIWTRQLLDDIAVDPSTFYQDNISSQIVQGKCITCHTNTGVASVSRLHFERSSASNYQSLNHQVWSDFINLNGINSEFVLSRMRGDTAHTGGALLPQGSNDYNVLETYLGLVKE